MDAQAVEAPPACPRCGFADPGPVECVRCGVVLAKARAARPAETPTLGGRPSEARGFSWFDAALLAGLAASGSAIWIRSKAPAEPMESRAPRPGTRSPARVNPLNADPAAPSVREMEIAPPPVPAPPPPVEAFARGGPAILATDVAEIARLGQIIQRQATIEDADVRAAEDLHSRHPQMPTVVYTLERVLIGAGHQAREKGRQVDAGRLFTRATEALPESSRVWASLIYFLSESRDWREMELAARRGLSARPADGNLHRSLAIAFMRQDRNQEAIDVLRRALALEDSGETRSLIARLQVELDSGRGMAQRTSSHFRVRFEGEADDALGAALVRLLEEKYAMLERTFGYAPDVEIPVLLYPRQTFKAVSSAPGWARASYSHFDGRIRIGTRGLAASFVPLDLERTLTHELVHAFVDGRTRGTAPRDINEGLAQYHSGRRLGYRLARSRAAPSSGSVSVDDFYDSALSFVEYLTEKHRQSSMNDLLTAMGEADLDKAFRRAYGQDYGETRAEWIRQLD